MRWTMSGYDPLRLYLKQLKAGGVSPSAFAIYEVKNVKIKRIVFEESTG